MRIAVSGTHFIGKSTLIEDFIKQHPHYRLEMEPYYQLQNEKAMELSLEPSFESLLEQLDYSIDQINACQKESDVIFDRCPVDFLAYAMCALQQDDVDIHDSELSDRLVEIKLALVHVDVIVFLPISIDNSIDYTEENPAYRKASDKCFKRLYRDDLYDIFPRYNQPRILELVGDRTTRLKKLDNYLTPMAVFA